MNRRITRTLLALALAPLPLAAQQGRAPRWQQGVDYRIEARLEEGSDVLHGRARLRYTNRSPRALDTLYIHQHLNAFRPSSAWARREAEYGELRFQDLGPAEHAFERFTAVQVDGFTVRPVYPLSPDSTVAAIPLPRPLRSGQSATVWMDWDARLSTLPRRQGRRGRHFDWAQWYPRIAVFDHTGWAAQPLLPQGEFYGEFGRYDVTLDLPADQVVGATGVAVEGNPGYAMPEAAQPGFARTAERLGLLPGTAAASGRKRVRFVASDVHHFGWASDPRFQHEGVTRFSLNDAGQRTELPAIHVLFLPEDTSWAGNRAARRTLDAIQWVGSLIGPYPYPQITNLHRLESGGTEFPMLVMNGSASEGLIVHEVTHQWLHGILANNEWREGWLDEGFTSFVTNWYTEEKLRREGNAQAADTLWFGAMRGLERLERVDSTQALALPGAEYRSPRIYSAMTYTKGSAVLRMLRDYLGEPTFRRVLRRYYDQYRFRHVTGRDFFAVAEQVSGRDLDEFYAQWIEGTAKLDYSIASARTARAADGRWRTEAELVRTGDAWLPVTVRAGDAEQRVTGRAARQTVVLTSRERPTEVVADPNWVLIDPNRANNRAPVP
ncbi:MAG TPA: M1 family metallopeptidase [Longimicrobium sp.]